jgi:hypothetical protein
MNKLYLIPLWLGLALANFIYQAFANQHWQQAIERSWFQLIALVAVVIIQKIKP